MLAGKGIKRAGYGSKDLWSKGDGMIRAGYGASTKNKNKTKKKKISTSSFN